MTQKKSKRARNCATICYQEDISLEEIVSLIPDDVSGFISPLHVEPGKKAHYHVLIMFDNARSLNTFDELFAPIHGRGIEVVRNLRQYAQYLCHLNNPDKKQYDINDVVQFGGADYSYYLGSQPKNSFVRPILSFIEEENIMDFAELIYKLSSDSELSDLFDYAVSHHSFFRDYVKSRTWSMKERIRLDDLIQKNELKKVDRFETEQLKF